MGSATRQGASAVQRQRAHAGGGAVHARAVGGARGAGLAHSFGKKESGKKPESADGRHRVSVRGQFLPDPRAGRRPHLRRAQGAERAGAQSEPGHPQLPARHRRYAGRKPYTDHRFARSLVMRTAEITRNTKETQIRVKVNLDGKGIAKLSTGVPFLEHMLDQVARHGMLDLDIEAKGDLHIDGHHTVEDIGITLGQAVAKAIGDKAGVRRFGHAYVPLDEALSRVVLDFSGRPGLEYHVKFTRALIGEFDVDLMHEFFQGFVNHALVTLHIDNLRGDNAHHQCETMFKAFARALRMAAEADPRATGTIPSTKGSL